MGVRTTVVSCHCSVIGRMIRYVLVTACIHNLAHIWARPHVELRIRMVVILARDNL
jgi:hypothetical protein